MKKTLIALAAAAVLAAGGAMAAPATGSGTGGAQVAPQVRLQEPPRELPQALLLGRQSQPAQRPQPASPQAPSLRLQWEPRVRLRRLQRPWPVTLIPQGPLRRQALPDLCCEFKSRLIGGFFMFVIQCLLSI